MRKKALKDLQRLGQEWEQLPPFEEAAKRAREKVRPWVGKAE